MDLVHVDALLDGDATQLAHLMRVKSTVGFRVRVGFGVRARGSG